MRPTNFEEHIAALPTEVRERMEAVRAAVRATAPGAEEIFSYGIPGFRLGKAKLWFAAFKGHIGMYPLYAMTGLDPGIEAWRAKTSQHTLHFPHGRPLPVDVVEKFVKAKFEL